MVNSTCSIFLRGYDYICIKANVELSASFCMFTRGQRSKTFCFARSDFTIVFLRSLLIIYIYIYLHPGRKKTPMIRSYFLGGPYMYTYIYIYTYAHIYKYIYIYTPLNKQKTYCACIYIYIHIYTYIYYLFKSKQTKAMLRMHIDIYYTYNCIIYIYT